jgi:hypothetical protein
MQQIITFLRKAKNMILALLMGLAVVLAVSLLVFLSAALKGMLIPLMFFCGGVYLFYHWLEGRQ